MGPPAKIKLVACLEHALAVPTNGGDVYDYGWGWDLAEGLAQV